MRVLFSQSERDWPFTIRTSPATGHFGVSEAGTRDVWSIRRDTGTHWRDLQVRTALSRSGAVWRSAARVGPPDGMARTPGFRFVSFDVASRAVALCAAHIARRRADVRNVTGTPVSCGPRHRLRPAATVAASARNRRVRSLVAVTAMCVCPTGASAGSPTPRSCHGSGNPSPSSDPFTAPPHEDQR